MTPQAIRERRLAHPLTQTELAVLVGVSLRTVKHWEEGRHHPHPSLTRKLGVVFGLRAPEQKCPIRSGGCGCRCHGRLPRSETAVLDMRRRTA
jgi:DNA-binding XRE family transcriptional regulator